MLECRDPGKSIPFTSAIMIKASWPREKLCLKSFLGQRASTLQSKKEDRFLYFVKIKVKISFFHFSLGSFYYRRVSLRLSAIHFPKLWIIRMRNVIFSFHHSPSVDFWDFQKGWRIDSGKRNYVKWIIFDFSNTCCTTWFKHNWKITFQQYNSPDYVKIILSNYKQNIGKYDLPSSIY